MESLVWCKNVVPHIQKECICLHSCCSHYIGKNAFAQMVSPIYTKSAFKVMVLLIYRNNSFGLMVSPMYKKSVFALVVSLIYRKSFL